MQLNLYSNSRNTSMEEGFALLNLPIESNRVLISVIIGKKLLVLSLEDNCNSTTSSQSYRLEMILLDLLYLWKGSVQISRRCILFASAYDGNGCAIGDALRDL